MNAAIELHDSRVSNVTQVGDFVTIGLTPAYVHRSHGRPGVDAGTGWTQDARIVFHGARIEGDPPELPCDVMDGEWIAIDTAHPNAIPLPLSEGAVELRLLFYPGCELRVAGSRAELELIGEARYVEDFIP